MICNSKQNSSTFIFQNKLAEKHAILPLVVKRSDAPSILLLLRILEKPFRGLKRKFGTHVVKELAKKSLPYRYHLLGSYLAFTEATPCPVIREMWEINWKQLQFFKSLKTHNAKFSVDSGWQKSKKTTQMPVLAAAWNAAFIAAISISYNECVTPEGLQVLKADGKIKLNRCAALALHLNKHRKFAKEARRKVSSLL